MPDKPDIHVLYVIDTPLRHPGRIIDRALKRAQKDGRIKYLRHDLAIDTPESAPLLHKAITENAFDAVICPERIQRLLPALEERVPLFDLEWLFEDDTAKFFVDVPDTGHGFLDPFGNLGGFDYSGGCHNIWEFFERMEKLLDPDADAPPKGHLGGRVASPVLYAGGILGIKLLEWGVSSSVETVKEAVDGAMEKINEAVKTIDWPKPDQPTEPLKGQEPDDSGRDFLLELNEAYYKAAMDELWRQIMAGTLPPEKTDLKQEFVYWLDQRFANTAALKQDRMLKEEDETGYAFAYWLYRSFGAGGPRPSAFWYYLWKNGAPIDPVDPPANMGKVFAVSGRYSPTAQLLELDFVG